MTLPYLTPVIVQPSQSIRVFGKGARGGLNLAPGLKRWAQERHIVTSQVTLVLNLACLDLGWGHNSVSRQSSEFLRGVISDHERPKEGARCRSHQSPRQRTKGPKQQRITLAIRVVVKPGKRAGERFSRVAMTPVFAYAGRQRHLGRLSRQSL
jgi:hypothetical protein